MVWHAVTTCNSEMWTAYGRTMAATFDRHWPAEIPLTVYTEGFVGDRNGRVRFVDLDQASPWLAPWKAARTDAQRGTRPEGYRFRWDAVKFSHKVAAIGASADLDADIMIWLDADIVTHAPVTHDWLESLFPASADLAWLDRERCYPECGVLMFRLPSAGPVIWRIVKTYLTGDIFKLQQWHDSYVIETVVKSSEAMGQIKIASLSGDARRSHHPCVAGPLGACIDHIKGARKVRGQSKQGDLMGRRPEPYWQ